MTEDPKTLHAKDTLVRYIKYVGACLCRFPVDVGTDPMQTAIVRTAKLKLCFRSGILDVSAKIKIKCSRG